MNKKTSVLLIDDELLARQLINSYLHHHPDIEIVGECADGFSGLKAIKELKPDLVFLDIQMPKLTGFEMLDVLDDPPVIVFSTAYDEFALKAFEANAADYLLKPYSQERFDAALEKARSRIGKGQTGNEMAARITSEIDKEPMLLHRLVLKTNQGIEILATEAIDFLTSADDYTEIVSGNKKYLKQKPLKYFDDHLDPVRFVRTHRTTILNIGLIARLEPYGKESWIAVLKSGQKLPVSKTGYQRLKELLKL